LYKLSSRKKPNLEEKYLQGQLPQFVIHNLLEKKKLEDRQKMKNRISMVASIGLAVIVWWIVADFFIPNIPNPVEVLKSALPTITDPSFYNGILASMGRVYTGFILGVIAGTFVGLMMGWKTRVRNWTYPSAELLRAIPPVAWVPLAIIILSSLSPAIILVIFIGVFFAVALNAMLGVQSIDRSLFRAATCLGAKEWHFFRHILLPGSLPSILYGMVLGMGLAWLSVVAAEMISGDYGIGYLALQSYNLVRFPEILLAMLTIGALSYASSEIIRLIVNRFLKWKKVYV
jgi:NitT/TauT family transport system permease protein